MTLVKHLVGCASVLLVFSFVDAAEVRRIQKRTDDGAHTYVIEPTNNNNEMEQQDVTTLIPPLVEGEPSAVSVFYRING